MKKGSSGTSLLPPDINVRGTRGGTHMDKLEELKTYVANLFDAATDKTTIEKSAIVQQKIQEVEQEQTKLREDYNKLLKDYKDVILHTSFAPEKGNAADAAGVPNSFDPDSAFQKFFIDAAKK